jgi:leucyl-tRNA synthetase
MDRPQRRGRGEIRTLHDSPTQPFNAFFFVFSVSQISFSLDSGDSVKVFTTRPDTIMGVTYLVVAPEHPLARKMCTPEQAPVVDAYLRETAVKSDLERTAVGASKAKSGVATGAFAKHPLTGERVPVWVADYVLGSYGTGAVMAVPAHDERDLAFAVRFDLPVKKVVAPLAADDSGALFTGEGIAVNSGEFNGLESAACRVAVVSALAKAGKGSSQVTYKLRDWVFSRQRYWGEPIPIYFPVEMDSAEGNPRVGDKHTIRFDLPMPVPDSELPLRLPELDDYAPGDDPQGCLARAADWRFFQRDGKWFARETNTMPQWAGSCWYYLRFTDPTNSAAPWSAQADRDWMPVDLYVGGQEHAVLHLLYARFWHKVLHRLGLTACAEPFQKLVHQGMILGSDGEKMSKSRGNVVNPDDVVKEHGADALRLYEMFMGPLEAVKPWQVSQVSGVVRFRNRVHALATRAVDKPMNDDTARILHKTMKKVTGDIDAMAFNTAIAAMMVLTGHLTSLGDVPKEAVSKLVLLVSPMAPHLGEECWKILGHDGTIAYEPWVQWDEALCIEDTAEIGVQVNGKLRGSLQLSMTTSQDEAKTAALAIPTVSKFIGDSAIKKIVYVPGRILNIIV